MEPSNLVAEFIRVGAESKHTRERISVDFARRCVRSGADGAGLLALFIGVANWGVDWTAQGAAPQDPASREWEGSRAGHGKHLTDCELGGLSIAHIDSSALQKTYEVWGAPAIPRDARDKTFDQLRNAGGANWHIWVRWAKALVAKEEFLQWVVAFWLKKYWTPSVEQNLNVGMEATLINARIRNSVSGVATRVAGQSADKQAAEYIAYKLKERGPSAAERAERQVNEMRRVLVLLSLDDRKVVKPCRKK